MKTKTSIRTHSCPLWHSWIRPSRWTDRIALDSLALAALVSFPIASSATTLDDFKPLPQWPYTARGEWTPYFFNPADAARWVVTNENGALRIRTLSPVVDGRILIMPPGPEVTVGDFYASVDILDWPLGDRACGIAARGSVESSNGYYGKIGRKNNQIRIWDGNQDVIGPTFIYNPAADYRMEFMGVGNHLSFGVVNLTTGAVQQMSVTNSQWSQGPVALWVTAPEGGSLDITLDNFFVTGTKP
jgi:hypothetical protein